MDEALVDICIETFQNSRNTHHAPMARFALMKNGKILGPYHEVCYASISRYVQEQTPDYLLVTYCGVDDNTINQPLEKHFKKTSSRDYMDAGQFMSNEQSREFLEFLLTDTAYSSLAPWIVIPDIDFINNNGFIIRIDDNLPGELLLCMLIASRVPWEHFPQYARWKILKDKLPPKLAFLIGSGFSFDTMELEAAKFVPIYMGGHCSLSGLARLYPKRWLGENPKPSMPLAKTHSSGSSKIFAEGNGGFNEETFEGLSNVVQYLKHFERKS